MAEEVVYNTVLSEELEEASANLTKRFNVAISIVLVFTIISGAMRKWVFPTGIGGNIIFGVQLLVPLVILAVNGDERLQKSTTPNWEKVYFLVLILLMFNPLGQSIFHGVIGAYLYSIFYLVMRKYFSYRDHVNLTPLFWLILAIAAVEFLLGSAQYFLPEGHILNYQIKIKGFDPGVAKVGENLRVSGTFSYLGGYGTFVSLVGYLVWSQLVQKRKLALLVPFALAGIGCALFSGSRGAIINFSVFLIFGLSGYFTSLKDSLRLLFFAGVSIFIMSKMDLGEYGNTFTKGLENIGTRFGDTDKLEDSDLGGRSLGPVLAIFKFDLPIGFNAVGIGLASTYQGTNIIWGTSAAARMVGGWEDEVGRVLIEGGYLLYFFRILIMFYVVRKMQWPSWMILPFFIYLFFFTQIVINIYGTIFTFLGLMFVDNSYFRMKKRKDEIEEEDKLEELRTKAVSKIDPDLQLRVPGNFN